MHRHSIVSGMARRFSAPLFGLAALIIGNDVCAQSSAGDAAGSPCIQELTEEKAKSERKKSKEPGWLSRNLKVVTGTIGAAGGAILGSKLCDDEAPDVRRQCQVYGGLGGALLGSKLGQMMSDAEQKRYQEATYQVALTGRPQSLSLDKGCVLVEAQSEATFEERQFELALAPSVAPPPKLRSVAMPYVRPSAASVSGTPSAGKALTKVGANTPSFVMGSTEGGKWLLLGREDDVQNYVGAGYVEAKDWVQSPESSPAAIAAGAVGSAALVTLGVEVRCTQISSSIRVQSTNKQETFPAKTCILPNGVAELPQETQ